MKTGIHPEYRQVIFHDTSIDKHFIIGSTVETKETLVWSDGKTYPYVTLDISSESHPFYTGQQRHNSSEGRASKFQRRFGSRIKTS